MKNRIHQLFQEKDKKIISVYFTAGFPEIDSTRTILKHLESAGADMVEIGIPFSDPLADGPTIQGSSEIALKNGMTLSLLFKQLEGVRTQTSIPILLMGYLNPILQFGEEKFIEKCAEIGIDGIIVPDMPLNYYENRFKKNCLKNNISNILLITPETTTERIQRIDKKSNGFIYMVSSNSITGNSNKLKNEKEYFERISKMSLKNPVITGFGINNKDKFDFACNYSNGCIIGSAFIEHLSKNNLSEVSIKTFLKTFTA